MKQVKADQVKANLNSKDKGKQKKKEIDPTYVIEKLMNDKTVDGI